MCQEACLQIQQDEISNLKADTILLSACSKMSATVNPAGGATCSKSSNSSRGCPSITIVSSSSTTWKPQMKWKHLKKKFTLNDHCSNLCKAVHLKLAYTAMKLPYIVMKMVSNSLSERIMRWMEGKWGQTLKAARISTKYWMSSNEEKHF